jgi:myo-inositol-1-phosphate synthase
MDTLRVAIVGLGNCAKNFCEFLGSGDKLPEHPVVTGAIGRPRIGRYGRENIKVTAAFDIDERKVHRRLAEALAAEPNCASAVGSVDPTDVVVARAPTLDSLPDALRSWIWESPEPALDRSGVLSVLQRQHVAVVVLLVPSGSNATVRWWAETCMAARVNLVNGTAAFLVDDDAVLQGFADASSCYIGDDMKSQLGATVLHRALLDLFERQGVTVESTSQLNSGGNADFANLAVRGSTKITSKSGALLSGRVGNAMPVHIGLHFDSTRGDRKRAMLTVNGRTICNSSVSLTATLDVDDSGNAVAILFDAVRCAAEAQHHGEFGYLSIPSARLMKHPRQDGECADTILAYDDYVAAFTASTR